MTSDLVTPRMEMRGTETVTATGFKHASHITSLQN
jgi:hypothetical protein